jgi:xylan 1,4-beta-xylosidase
MYARMGRQQVLFESSAGKDPLAYADICGRGDGPDISGFAALGGSNSLAILVYNHHDDWDVSGEYIIELEAANLPFGGDVTVTHYRIDQTHSNAYAEWVRQGRPMYPAPGQRTAIMARSGLEMLCPPQRLAAENGKLRLSFALPVHGISLICLHDHSQLGVAVRAAVAA